MIRRNVVSIVAVCGALAVGVALGSGPLSDLGHADPQPAKAPADVSRQVREEASAGASFASAVGQRLLAGSLSGKRVTVVAMPGADTATTRRLSDQIRRAGGTVGNTVRILPAALDPSRKTFDDTLARQLARQFAGRVRAGQTTYRLFGQVIGATYGAHVQVSASTADQLTASKTLVAGKVVRADLGPGPGTLGLLVLGDHVDPSVLTDLVAGVGAAFNGLVVAGDSASAHGDLRLLRAQHWGSWFASVDGIDTEVGRVATGLALARQVHRRGGDFGASGFEGIAATG